MTDEDEAQNAAEDDGNKGYGEPPEPRRVTWLMRYQDGKEETIFEGELALAALLMKEKIFLNSHWWETDWPEAARRTTSLNVNCNDVFAWGCADAEELPLDELQSVWQHYLKDPDWGTEVWCILRRKQMPQRPVEKLIRNAGIWGLDALKAEHGLRANYYDGVSHVMADRKYKVYCEWAQANGQEPCEWGPGWWAGWTEYIAANPGWNSAEWQAEDSRLIAEWRAANGWAEPAPEPQTCELCAEPDRCLSGEMPCELTGELLNGR